MRVLTTVLTPTSGTVSMDGILYCEGNYPKIQRQIGYLPQEIDLYPGLTVQECIPCAAILRVWAYSYGNRESGDCAGGTDAGGQRRRYLLELVWFFQQRGMVCLLCKLVC